MDILYFLKAQYNQIRVDGAVACINQPTCEGGCLLAADCHSRPVDGPATQRHL